MCLIRLKETIMKLSEMETGRKGIEIVQNAKRRPLLVFERDSVVALDRADCKNIEVDVLS